nr:hypothetical protein CFP56_62663 [Quercus suber]
MDQIKNLKSEPLASLTSGSKKRKLGDEKVEVSLRPSAHIAPPSPTPSLEVTAISPLGTRARGKSKIGMNVWDDPATALGHAHNIITTDELKSLSSVPSHELISCHIHKLVQVLGESLRITTDYLGTEEKIVMASSKAESVEAEWFELLRRWTMKHHSSAMDFSSLDFEKIDIEVLEDEAKELEEAEFGVLEKDKAAEDRKDDGANKVADEPPTLPA